MKKVNLVVVVSQYWKSYLESKGIRNIKVIYNSYNLEEYKITDKEVELLKKKLKISSDKPIIYLGKIGEGKGIKGIMQHLDYSKYNLIATGKQRLSSSNFKSCFLSKEEYPVLLKMADVVLAMSTMPEGWNRIAHEAMLVKTPVIGSGSGGMYELLEKGSQSISTFSNLESEIQRILRNKDKLGNLAFNFVKQFDMEYFKTEWLTLINHVRQ